jgi:NUDIX domain.
MAEAERLEHGETATPEGRRHNAASPAPVRPRDSATLILIDWRGGEPFVLMGRRHARHAFMPGRFVFPGGRTDPSDSRITVASDLHPAEAARIAGSARDGRARAARARAIALSALRETYEEAGLLVGRKADFATRSPQWQGFAKHGIQPALDGLRYIARAITPPGNVRRFDTRFLAARRDEVAVELPSPPTEELEGIAWLPITEALRLNVAAITRRVLEELGKRLQRDPTLSPGEPVPFYFTRGGRFRREML